MELAMSSLTPPECASRKPASPLSSTPLRIHTGGFILAQKQPRRALLDQLSGPSCPASSLSQWLAHFFRQPATGQSGWGCPPRLLPGSGGQRFSVSQGGGLPPHPHGWQPLMDSPSVCPAPLSSCPFLWPSRLPLAADSAFESLLLSVLNLLPSASVLVGFKQLVGADYF